MCQNVFSHSGGEESRGNQVDPRYTTTPGGYQESMSRHEGSTAVVMSESHGHSPRVEKHRRQLSRITFLAPPSSPNESEPDPVSPSSVVGLESRDHTTAFRSAHGESTATAMARDSEAYLRRIQENRRRISRMTFLAPTPSPDESEHDAALTNPVNIPDRNSQSQAFQFQESWSPSPELTLASAVNDSEPSHQSPSYRFQEPWSASAEPARLRFVDDVQDFNLHTYFNNINRIPDHPRYPHSYHQDYWSCPLCKYVDSSRNDLRVWLSQYAFATCPECNQPRHYEFGQGSGNYGIISKMTLI